MTTGHSPNDVNIRNWSSSSVQGCVIKVQFMWTDLYKKTIWLMFPIKFHSKTAVASIAKQRYRWSSTNQRSCCHWLRSLVHGVLFSWSFESPLNCILVAESMSKPLFDTKSLWNNSDFLSFWSSRTDISEIWVNVKKMHWKMLSTKFLPI